MKFLSVLLLLPFAAPAQSSFPISASLAQELVRSGVILVLIYLLSSFILTVLHLVLDHQLKKQLLAAGATESLVAQLLPRHQDRATAALKWFALLTALALGLLIGSLYQPWGIHSVIILLFSLALGFLAYYFLLRRLTQ
jgi:TctA family transporter